MKVTLERAALLKALGHVHRVVERRTTIPILSNVLIRADRKALTLKATDLDLEVTETIPADIGQSGGTTLPAHTLYDIVRKLAEGAQVSLETSGETAAADLLLGHESVNVSLPSAENAGRTSTTPCSAQVASSSR